MAQSVLQACLSLQCVSLSVTLFFGLKVEKEKCTQSLIQAIEAKFISQVVRYEILHLSLEKNEPSLVLWILCDCVLDNLGISSCF